MDHQGNPDILACHPRRPTPPLTAQQPKLLCLWFLHSLPGSPPLPQLQALKSLGLPPSSGDTPVTAFSTLHISPLAYHSVCRSLISPFLESELREVEAGRNGSWEGNTGGFLLIALQRFSRGRWPPSQLSSRSERLEEAWCLACHLSPHKCVSSRAP